MLVMKMAFVEDGEQTSEMPQNTCVGPPDSEQCVRSVQGAAARDQTATKELSCVRNPSSC